MICRPQPWLHYQSDKSPPSSSFSLHFSSAGLLLLTQVSYPRDPKSALIQHTSDLPSRPLLPKRQLQLLHKPFVPTSVPICASSAAISIALRASISVALYLSFSVKCFSESSNAVCCRSVFITGETCCAEHQQIIAVICTTVSSSPYWSPISCTCTCPWVKHRSP